MTTKAGESYRGKQGKIGYILRQAQHTVRLKIDAALRDLNVTHPQFVVLSILDFEPDCHSADIARISMFSPQAINKVITRLEKAGHITRKPHATHGRVLTIELTPTGDALLKQCRKKVSAIEKQLLKNLSEQDEAIIRNWLVHCTQL